MTVLGQTHAPGARRMPLASGAGCNLRVCEEHGETIWRAVDTARERSPVRGERRLHRLYARKANHQGTKGTKVHQEGVMQSAFLRFPWCRLVPLGVLGALVVRC